MCKRKCLLTVWALAFLILMVMPDPAPNCRRDPQYPHSFYTTDDCKTLICKVCGIRKGQAYVVHELVRIDCYRRQCTRCGLTEAYESHPRFCGTVRQCADCGKEFEKMLPDEHVWERQTVDCTYISVCILCGEKKTSTLVHKWIGENCEEGQWCRVCGVWNSKPAKHIFYTNLAGLVTCCRYCNYTEVTVSSADWVLMAVWLLGILWLVFALCYAARTRGTVYLDRNILRSTWQDWDETAPNLRSWRG